MKDKEGKTEVCDKTRDFGQGRTLVKEGLSRNKVLFSSQQSRTANGSIYQM